MTVCWLLVNTLFGSGHASDLAKNADPAELARYVMTVLQGMAVQGADGASPDQLSRVAQVALRAWLNLSGRLHSISGLPSNSDLFLPTS